MLTNQKIEKALNNQIHHEFTNAYAYLAISVWFNHQNLPGFAKWMRVQHQEELTHAAKLIAFLTDRGGRVELEALAKPQANYGSPKDAMTAAMKIEQATTAMLNNIFGIAVEEQEYATQSFLKWFVDEQVEEEKNVGENLAMLQMAGDSKGTLLMLDHKLGKRGKA